MEREGEALERLDRMAALGELLAEVAHEIRNPLVSMKTFLELVPDHRDDPAFIEDFRKVVQEELGRMDRLLDALLRQARPERDTIAEDEAAPACQVADVFDALLRLLQKRAEQREVKLQTNIEEGLPAVAIGEDPLRQIVLNLVLNALDASPPASCVSLRAGAQAGQITVSVEDEGEGVPEALRSKLFEPFFSTREDRTGGLGLSIAKRLAEQAGGTIAVETGHTGGARFVVALPRAADR